MQPDRYRAYICCGPNCGPKDSGALLTYLSNEIENRGLEQRVSVYPTGCQAHCLSGPTMVVYPGPVYYQEVTVDKLNRIIVDHFLEGRPVEEYFWTGRRLRILPKPVLGRPVNRTAQPDPDQRPPEAERGYAEKKSPVRKAPDVDDFKW